MASIAQLQVRVPMDKRIILVRGAIMMTACARSSELASVSVVQHLQDVHTITKIHLLDKSAKTCKYYEIWNLNDPAKPVKVYRVEFSKYTDNAKSPEVYCAEFSKSSKVKDLTENPDGLSEALDVLRRNMEAHSSSSSRLATSALQQRGIDVYSPFFRDDGEPQKLQ